MDMTNQVNIYTGEMAFKINRVILGIIVLCCLTTPILSQEQKKLTLYLSADMTGAKESGNSIEQGILTALSETDYRLGSYDITLKTLDHRGSTPRAKKHLQQFLNDPTALAIFSGMHSPPLLTTRDMINQKEILVMVPWAAAGPITRYPSDKNWIFRLSIDDTKAGYVIAQTAINDNKKKPALLLEETGWGKSNNLTMTNALSMKNLEPVNVTWFNWGVGIHIAKAMLLKINKSGADAIFLVANAKEGETIIRAMANLPKKYHLPIYSHWGITGGNFPENVKYDTREKLQLRFIQTRASFLGNLTPFQQQVLDKAKQLFPEKIQEPKDIRAPAGFIHAYDLTKILISAFEKADKQGDILSIRRSVRNALENLDKPIQGLIKEYTRPFSTYSESNPDGHEALNINDFTMAKYGKSNEVILFD